MLARIFRPAKNAMQSGRRNTKRWVLEFEPASARFVEPLMGWTGSADQNGQVRLSFATREEAIAYAEKHNIPFEVLEPHATNIQIKPYADNFSFYKVR
jgi:hypothetical protein